MLYKLTKGSVSKIRDSKEACDLLIKDGYKMAGEVNKDFDVINPYPIFGEKEVDELAELREKAVKLGLAPSTAARLKTEKALLGKIEDLEEKE